MRHIILNVNSSELLPFFGMAVAMSGPELIGPCQVTYSWRDDVISTFEQATGPRLINNLRSRSGRKHL